MLSPLVGCDVDLFYHRIIRIVIKKKHNTSIYYASQGRLDTASIP